MLKMNHSTQDIAIFQEGHLEVLKYLVEEGGASLRILSYDGMSCLHAAAQTGKVDTVKWLVSSLLYLKTINCWTLAMQMDLFQSMWCLA